MNFADFQSQSVGDFEFASFGAVINNFWDSFVVALNLEDLNEVDVLGWWAEIFRDSFYDEVEDWVSETEVNVEQVRQQEFDHFIELHDSIESSEKFEVLGLDGDTQGESVFALVDVVIDAETDDVSVLGRCFIMKAGFFIGSS